MRSVISRSEQARSYHEFQGEVDRIIHEVQVFLDSDPVGKERAVHALLHKARGLWKHDQHYSLTGWVRPLDKVDRMFDLGVRIFELGRVHPRWAEQDRELHETEREYSALCEELGVLEPIGNPDQHRIRAIARAVEAGAASNPEGRPEDWPPYEHWITEPAAWDPDWYVALSIEPYLNGEALLAGMHEDELRLCAVAALLARDNDRIPFDQMLEEVQVLPGEREVAGKTKSLKELWWGESCSPIRWWVLSRNFLLETEEGMPSNEWALMSRWELDQAIKALGEAILDLTTARTGWDLWIPAAMEMLEEEPVMVSELQRRLQTQGFPIEQKPRERLSSVLRGAEPWPGRGRTVRLAKTERKRLVPEDGWRARIAEVLGKAPPTSEDGHRSPF